MQAWEKLGRVLAPNPEIPWLVSHVGASFALPNEESPSSFDLYVTGRDKENRSLIGRALLDLESPNKIKTVETAPVLTLGERGAFDENGTSYPWLIRERGETFLFYTGWVPTVLTPFQNHLGLARKNEEGNFSRVSRAPILSRDNEDFLSIGSACVLKEEGTWRMWYTSFLSWGKERGDSPHRYVIKYAESKDGLNWDRSHQICIDIQNPGEHSIGRPSVIKISGRYHMWYCYRGENYRIGYADSRDGIVWTRKDNEIDLGRETEDWEKEAQAYPHVISHEKSLYLFYSGNRYGQGGLGLARLPLEAF